MSRLGYRLGYPAPGPAMSEDTVTVTDILPDIGYYDHHDDVISGPNVTINLISDKRPTCSETPRIIWNPTHLDRIGQNSTYVTV